MSNSHPHPTRGLMMMVVAPSGVGKTSLTRRLVSDHPDLHLSISATTREPRAGEHEGRDYHFVSHDQFDQMVEDNAFLEWAEVHGNKYGSPRAPIEEALSRGESVLFDIDDQGAFQVCEQARADCVMVYILPPSIAEMNRRLHTRSTDSDETIRRRIARAKTEITNWQAFDYVLLNDDFDRAYSDLAHVYHAERLKRSRGVWIGDFVQSLLDEPLP